VHPVSEDESSSASAYAGFGVALAGAVVRGSLAVGVYVGAVDGDDVSLHRPILQQTSEALAEAFKRGTTITEMVFNGVSGAIGTMIGTWMMIIFGP
jgi:hypothetical protein